MRLFWKVLNPMKHYPFKTTLGILLVAAMSLSSTACHRETRRTLVLGAYSTPREAFQKINGLFEKHWRERTGENIKVEESYLGSGAQSRAVVDGFEADVVALAVAPDVDRIVEAGLITHPWRQGPQGGMITQSVVAFAVRPGNPWHVHDWRDLLQPGLELLTPNPKTSGGAQWNILAAYGAALRGHVPPFSPDETGARDFLEKLLKRVIAMDKAARESLLTFERGIGDVALSYENEIREGKAKGMEEELVFPTSTILIQNPVAVVDKNVERHKNMDLAEAYVAFLYSTEAQKIFYQNGFRPVIALEGLPNPDVWPQVKDLFTIQTLGGWQKISPKFFGAKGIFTEAVERIQRK